MSRRSKKKKNSKRRPSGLNRPPQHRPRIHRPPAKAIRVYHEGLALQEAGRLAEAEAAFQRAIELAPRFADAHNDLGVCYYLQRRFHEALAACRQALDIEPRHDGALSNIGAISASLGNLDQAVEYFRHSLTLNPNSPETRANLERAQRELELHQVLHFDPPSSISDWGFQISDSAIRNLQSAICNLQSESGTISLCLIARDEEAHLPRLLDSVGGVVDEIVLVDTGSTDRTMEIARSYGARVIEFPWRDDFSAAKNEALSHATGDWILHLDADMYFEPGQAARIRQAAASGVADAYFIIVRSPTAGGVGLSELVQHPWLFRNRPEVRFEGAVHEQIMPAMQRAGMTLARTDIAVEHIGYANPIERKAKLVRNMRILRERLEAGEDEPILRFYLAQSHLVLEEPDQAIELLRPVLDAPGSPWRLRLNAHASLVEAYLQMDDHAQAQEIAERAVELFPHDRLAWVAAARANYEAGNYDAAMSCYQGALAQQEMPDLEGVTLYTDDGLLEAGIADCYRQKGEPAKAVAHYRRAQELGYNPMNVEFYLAKVYQALGQVGDAEDASRRAVGQSPNHPDPHRQLGLLLAESSRWTEAVGELEAAVRAGGGDPATLERLEDLYALTGDDEGLERVCRQAAEAGHVTEAVLSRLGLSVAEGQRGRGAEEQRSRGEREKEEKGKRGAEELRSRGARSEHRRRQAQVLAEHGIELLRSGQYRRAVQVFQEALQLDPVLPGLHTNLGICYYELGDYARAAEAYQAELKISPDDDRLHNNLGTLYAALGNFAEAVRHYERALEINPFNANARANLERARHDLAQHQMLRLDGSSREPEAQIHPADDDEEIGGGPSISLCLIARNEEKHLPRLLDSVSQAVDEIVLMDTGSTDRTVEIAQEYGARVIEFPWQDDFAAAKNQALHHATGDWILHLDADMVLPQGHAQRIRRAVASGRARVYFLQVRSPAAGPPVLYDVVLHPWLFENRPEVHFEGTVHEVILPSLLAQGMTPMRTDIVVDHVGYTDPVLLQAKEQRNLSLLEKRRADGDDAPSLPFHLAQTYLGLGRYDEAIAELEGLIAHPAEVRAILPTAYSYLAMARLASGDHEEGFRVAKEACRLFPHLRYPHYLAAAACLHLGNAEEARTWATQAQTLGDEPTTESFVLHVDDASLEALLGDCAQRQSRWAEAIAHYTTAVVQGLDSEPVRQALSTACHTLGAVRIQQGRPAEAVGLLEQAVALSPEGAGGLNDLGFARLQLGQYDQAAVAFGEAIRLDPESGRAHFNLGLALEKLGHREDAVLCIQRAMELDPGLRV